MISIDILKQLCLYSYETGRQLGLIINRSGSIEYVLAGTSDSITIPVLTRFKLAPGRLRGLRLIHTHPKGDGLDNDDMADLALLRLDSVTACAMDEKGYPKFMETAYITPPDINDIETKFGYLEDSDPYNQKTDYPLFIEALDDEIERKTIGLHTAKTGEYAVLTGVFKSKEESEVQGFL